MRERTVVPCDFPGCDRPSRANGLCQGHNTQKWRGGPLKPLRAIRYLPTDEKGRVCTECDEYKTYDNFYLTSDGIRYRARCKQCSSRINSASNQARKAREVK